MSIVEKLCEFLIEVVEVKTKKQLKEFVKFPVRLYENCRYYVPDLAADEMANFNPEKNPAYEYCEVRCFLAYKNGVLAGRIAAILSKKANEIWGTKRLRFSRIDFVDDPDVSAALIGRVEDWAKELGMQEIHGPIGFSDFDQQGMLVDGFDKLSMFITIYNHAYYKEHMEKLGYEKDIDWVEFFINCPTELDPRLEKLSELVLERNKLKLRTFDSKKQVKPYIPSIFKIIDAAYGNLYGVVPLNQRQVDKYVTEFLQLINFDYVRLLEDEDGKIVGFGLAIPSLAETVKKIKGKLFPLGWYHLLRAPHKKTETLDMYLVGVLPELQNKGLPAVLMSSITKSAIKNGVRFAETGPELETNHKVQAIWKNYNAEQHKRRRCWVKNIG